LRSFHQSDIFLLPDIDALQRNKSKHNLQIETHIKTLLDRMIKQIWISQIKKLRVEEEYEKTDKRMKE